MPAVTAFGSTQALSLSSSFLSRCRLSHPPAEAPQELQKLLRFPKIRVNTNSAAPGHNAESSARPGPQHPSARVQPPAPEAEALRASSHTALHPQAQTSALGPTPSTSPSRRSPSQHRPARSPSPADGDGAEQRVPHRELAVCHLLLLHPFAQAGSLLPPPFRKLPLPPGTSSAAPGAARASAGGAHARPAPAPRRVGRRRPRSASRLAVLLLRKTLGVSPVPSPQGHSLFHRAFLKSEALLSSLKMLLTHFCLCKPTFFLSIYLFIFNL